MISDGLLVPNTEKQANKNYCLAKGCIGVSFLFFVKIPYPLDKMMEL